MRFTAVLAIAFACSAALASQPGQPLDCSDWVFDQPGLSCSTEVPFPCGGPSQTDNPLCVLIGGGIDTDNDGDVLFMNTVWLNDVDCGYPTGLSRFRRYELTRIRNGVPEILAHIQERCGSTALDLIAPSGPLFDRNFGRVRLSASNYIGNTGIGSQVMIISGFSTTFDVLQTFTPQPATLGFRVSYMPEGLPAADHFDTYWGVLGHPIDFTQAHALQCDYPSTPPHIGDYLTVADTVPTPAPGQGVYYITSATHLGATRYGRKTTKGHLTGRDPALLPACVP